VLAFVLAAFFAYDAFISHRQPGGDGQGRIVFEADSAGKLRRVEAPSVDQAKTTPLWKPDPSFILARAEPLRLTSSQALKIRALEQGWANERQQLDKALELAFQDGTGVKTNLEAGRAVPVSKLRGGLEGYSELSQLYNRRRNSYWQRSLRLLSNHQRALIERLRAGETL
jgi:hypothetical protein